MQFKFYDDRSDAATAARLTERLITSDKVDLLLAPFGTAGTSTASAVSEKNRMVMINHAGASEAIHKRGFKYIFQVVTPVPYYVEGTFPLAKKAGFKSLVFVSRDYAAARDMEKAIREWAPENGIDIKMVEYFPAATTDFASYIARARDIQPDIWVSVGYPPEAIEMIRQMKATNYLPKMFVHNGVSQEDFLKAMGKDAEYAFGMSLYEPTLPTKGKPRVRQEVQGEVQLRARLLRGSRLRRVPDPRGGGEEDRQPGSGQAGRHAALAQDRDAVRAVRGERNGGADGQEGADRAGAQGAPRDRLAVRPEDGGRGAADAGLEQAVTRSGGGGGHREPGGRRRAPTPAPPRGPTARPVRQRH